MTGRGAGPCAAYAAPGYANPAPGFGAGMGYGFGRGGRGRRNRFYATGVPGWARGGSAWAVPPYAPAPAREQELDSLKAHVEDLQSALQQATERIAELDAQAQK